MEKEQAEVGGRLILVGQCLLYFPLVKHRSKQKHYSVLKEVIRKYY